jgi:hypothetical protein
MDGEKGGTKMYVVIAPYADVSGIANFIVLFVSPTRVRKV